MNKKSTRKSAKRAATTKRVAKKSNSKTTTAKNAPAASRPGRKPKMPDDTRVVVVAEKNPKRGKCARRFALYGDAPITVGEYVAAVAAAKMSTALARADVRWDLAHGYVRLAPAAQRKAA